MAYYALSDKTDGIALSLSTDYQEVLNGSGAGLRCWRSHQGTLPISS
jgi:hypothetical protein